MTRSAASRYIIMDYLKDKETAQHKIKIDPQLEEVRDAIITLNESIDSFPEISLPDDVDPVIAAGVRNTVIENMQAMGLDIKNFKEFIESTIKMKILSLIENKTPGSKALIEYYHKKAKNL